MFLDFRDAYDARRFPCASERLMLMIAHLDVFVARKYGVLQIMVRGLPTPRRVNLETDTWPPGCATEAARMLRERYPESAAYLEGGLLHIQARGATKQQGGADDAQ